MRIFNSQRQELLKARFASDFNGFRFFKKFICANFNGLH